MNAKIGGEKTGLLHARNDTAGKDSERGLGLAELDLFRPDNVTMGLAGRL
jgi:hypothetical protein